MMHKARIRRNRRLERVATNIIGGSDGECLAETAKAVEAACGKSPKWITFGNGDSYEIRRIDGPVVTLCSPIKRRIREGEAIYLSSEKIEAYG